MITNIVFGVEGVLRYFNRDYFLSHLNLSDNDRKLLEREVFESLELPLMDRGIVRVVEAARRVKDRLPNNLKPYGIYLIMHLDEISYPINGMVEIIKELKKNGYGLYVMTNASNKFYESWSKIPGHEYFDGAIVSSDYGVVKPQNEIYKLLKVKYGLQLNECLLVDDIPSYVEGAIHNRLDGIVFHKDAKELRRRLIKKGIKITEQH